MKIPLLSYSLTALGIASLSAAMKVEVRNSSQTSDLVPLKFETFSLGSVRPTGWLRDQIQLSADGLGGHLFEFYRYVARSTWLGGDFEYSELHESAPYWFNYIVPLAWTLDDQRLKAQARNFLDYVLENQASDGWLGPETTRQTRGIWARSLLCFGLTQYAEADVTQTDRIVVAMHKFVNLTHSMLQNNFTGLIQQTSEKDDFDPYGFGISRTHELPISLMWLYENHPRGNEATILETIDLMFKGGKQAGRDWTTFFVDGVFPKVGTPLIKTSGFTHGVNLAQGLRYPSVLYRFNGNESLVQQTLDAVNMTATYHTSLSGTIIADEHLGGLSPQRGSELCMAVESMFSYSWLYRLHGTNDFADRAERAAFNALPAGISPDWWSHQYVTQTNQPWSRNLTSTDPFYNVVTYGNTYGLEPNFPCCTVNHPQAYPKYIAASYVKTSDAGLAHVLLGPTSLQTTIGGSPVEVNCTTAYPFASTLTYTVKTGVSFDFAIRVPQWTTDQASIELSSLGNSSALKPDTNGLHHIPINQGTTVFTVTLPMQIDVVNRNRSIGVYYGPLLYAADIQYNDTSHQPLNWTDRTPLGNSEVDPRSQDHVLVPTSPWQYAIDSQTISVESKLPDSDMLPSPIFTRDSPPTCLWVDAYPVDWPVDHDTAALPPVAPSTDPATKIRLKLIPFAAAKLHTAQFPVVGT